MSLLCKNSQLGFFVLSLPVPQSAVTLDARNNHILPPVLNLTSPSCSSAAISLKTQKFRRFAYTFKADIGLLIFAWIFRTSWPKMGVLGGKWGRLLRCWPPTNSFLLWVLLRLCQFWWKSIKKCDRESAHGLHTETLTGANRQSHAIYYSYGADNQVWGQRWSLITSCNQSQNQFLGLKMHSNWFGLPYWRKPLTTL